MEIRKADNNVSFYEALLKSNVDNSELSDKIERFLNKLVEFQNSANYLKINELIWKIISETGYYYYVSLMNDGEKRTKNLKLFFEKAGNFEKTNLKGVFNFIKYIEKVILSKKDSTIPKLIGENDNVVRIMSIHKSKGLEFPVVFLCGAGKRFNMQDLRESIIFHAEYGIGPQYINSEENITYLTLAKEALKEKIKIELLSEEMRLLYVAFTRAKEKLFIVGIEKKTKLPKYKANSCNNYLQWIKLLPNTEENIHYYKMNEINESKDTIIERKIIPKGKLVINSFGNKICNDISSKIETKFSVSNIKNSIKEIKLNKKPEFLISNNKITGAEEGTIIHRILELMPLKKYNDIDEFKREVNNIVLEKNVDIGKIYNFTTTKLYERILLAENVEREKPFCMLIPYNEIYKDSPVKESVIVQGIIDCYFEENNKIILIDYKSDKIKNENDLKTRYIEQLEMYKKALEKVSRKEITEVYIYSLYLNKEIKIF